MKKKKKLNSKMISEIELMSGVHEVELTDELIKELVESKKWRDVESLKQMADMGAKWNLSRNSIILSF